jgi:transposase
MYRGNAKYKVIKELPTTNNLQVISDQIIKYTGKKALENNLPAIRLVTYYDPVTQKNYKFITNQFKWSAQTIVDIYKDRWQVELFFKWIKQHLKVKTFWGRTENAVRIQINIAIMTYCLISIIAKDLRINCSIYEIIQILSATLLDKTPVNEMLMKSDFNNANERITN